MAKKLSLSTKTLISLGLIGIGFGATYGAMYAYSKNSDEVKGSKNPYTKEELANNYSLIRNEKGDLTPTLAILNPLKNHKVADINEDGTLYWFVDNPEEKMDLDTFFKKYYEIYQEDFILEVKYASFSFYDEYVLAVRPKQFIDFTKWFMNNVAWGPDILTLESFRIVRGAEQHGNSITLGSHSTDRKESSEIKFFPDAFFGSLPIFSVAGGRGLAPDSLTYSAFQSNVNLETLEEFLTNIPLASAILNNRENSFTQSYLDSNSNAARDRRPNIEFFNGLLMPGRLLDKEFLVYRNDSEENLRKVALSSENSISQGLLLVLPKDTTAEQFNQIASANPELYQNVTFDQFELYQVADVTKEATFDPSGRKTPITMKVSFDKGENTAGFDHYYKEVPDTYFDLVSLQTYKNTVESQIENFLDFYDFNNFIGANIYVYEKNGKRFFYDSLAKAQDSLKIKDLDKSIAYKVNHFKKEKLSDGNYILYAYLDKQNSKTAGESPKQKVIAFNSGDLNELEAKMEFFQFKQALGYKGAIRPTVLSAGPENITLKDANGNQIRGLAARNYQLYNEVYSGLLDIILTKYPHLVKEYNGPHVEQVLNDQGFYEYKVVDGPYKGLNDGDRIGLPLVLNAFIDEYEGISTDFLKYVGAHEYGHHYTLEGTQALNNQNNSVVVGGLSTRGGVNIQSYYGIEGLMNYLKARTNLDIVRVDALGNEQPNGEFINFKFKKVSSNDWYKETEADVWGSAEKTDNVFDVVDNKARRFLQSYESMKEVAKLRDVRLGDLFIANSFDRNSGTLNPFIDGTILSFDSRQKTKFEPISEERIMNIVVDGVNQHIPYTVDDAGHVTLKIVESTTVNGRTMFTKVNVFNADGTPVIDVPLYKLLDHNSYEYVNKKIAVINDSIMNLVRDHGYDSGWDGPATVLGGNPKIAWTSVTAGDTFNEWRDEVKNRKNDVETDVMNNLYGFTINDKTRKAYSYLALSEDNNALNQYITRLEFFSKANYDGLPDKIDSINAAKIKSNSFDGALAGINPVVSISKKDGSHKRYSFPFATDAKSLMDMYRDIPSIKETAERYRWTVPYGAFFTGFDSWVFTHNREQLRSFGYLNSHGEFVGEPTAADSKVVVRPSAVNMSDTSPLIAASKFLQEIKNNGNKEKALVFKNFEEMLDFFTIDYSQFTKKELDNDNQQVKWNANIDYLQNYFDFDKFVQAAIKDDKSNANKLTNNQEIANDIIRRMRFSSFLLGVKDFNPTTDLVQNQAILSKEFGFKIFSPELANNYYEDASFIPEKDKRISLTADKLQELIKQTAIDAGITEQVDLNNINSFDLFKLIGNTMELRNRGVNVRPFYGNITFGNPSTGMPSSDFLSYNLSRIEPLINDKFTDYIYSLPETLTRDYVQTTYVPSVKNFGNLPSYLNNVNEATTGLDYIVDATQLDKINDTKLNHNQINLAQIAISQWKLFNKTQTEIEKMRSESFKTQAKLQPQLAAINQAIEDAKNEPDHELSAALISNLQTAKAELLKFLSDLSDDIQRVIDNHSNFVIFDSKILSNDQTEQRDSSYFGKFIANSNGYFKDRWEKAMIDMQLYDDYGNPVQIPENDRRLTAFDGETLVDNVPEAFFVSQLLNFGVGNRNVTGIFRNKNFDALALYGYIETKHANRIKYLKFTNKDNPKDVAYLSINISNTNNIFYLTKQGDASSKRTLADYGYSTWISDFDYMGKYRGSLLAPKSSYYVEFADADKNTVTDMTLGNVPVLAENGKLVSQAPIKLEQELDENGNSTGKTLFTIDYQFNILG
ncbi:PDxFFG protein [Mycoplasma buteonis]|uniref:PDxFFG protein n=1 Tax=Mycoplasma buteonis TaxID=171280 RepID=UPI00055A81DC|nr:PDxFFG protein [Mycoplasma buteonis]